MKKISIIFLVFIGLVATSWYSVQAEDEANFEEDRSEALDFLRRTLFHPTKTKCEEQKSEAKEDYEERCEPSNPVYRNQGTNRHCPDLDTWDDFKNYEINDGIQTFDDLKPTIKMPQLPRIPSADEVKNKVYDKVIGNKKRADNANRFLKRSFFHPGATKCEEQKREAREDYEERCEPSFPLYRNTGTNRFCPDINSWKEFDQYEIGNGYELTRTTSTPRYTDRDRYNTINRDNNKNRVRPLPTVPETVNDYDT